MKNLKDFIVVVPDVISGEDIQTVIDFAKSSTEWTSGQIRIGYDKDARDVNQLTVAHDTEVDRVLFNAVGAAIRGYMAALPDTGIKISQDEGYTILRYDVGQNYKEHIDSSVDNFRQVSCSIALNEDYAGGEWAFFDGEHVVKVPTGAAVLFPSNYCFPHAILPVTTGTRYSVVTWFV